MGMGGYLWIINAASRKLTLSKKHSHQMTKWDFDDVPSQTLERFYIEYEQIPSVHKTDSRGEASFQLEGTNCSFELQAHWPDNGECGLKVCWDMDTDLYDVFPPGVKGETFSKLGWIPNGSLALLILEKDVATSVCTSLPDESTIVNSRLTQKRAPPRFCCRWMEEYKHLLERLTLHEATLPGTHNSGTYEPVSALASPFVKTQNLSIAEQLEQGIRALDLRIGQKSRGHYIICHDKCHTRYSLDAALGEVKRFIDNTNKEVVVLDFHRFVALDGRSYNYAELWKQILFELSEYYVPPGFQDKTLGAIWSQGSPKRRIVVAWNRERERDESCMWPGVQHQWYSKEDTPNKLYKSIKKDTLTPPAAPCLWTECAFLTFGRSNLRTVRGSAERINPTITNWYFGGSAFCESANIISVDFFDEHSNVVQAAIVGSLLKAGRKH